jgi:cytochrome c-type biogenesis protein CcmH/NrfG
VTEPTFSKLADWLHRARGEASVVNTGPEARRVLDELRDFADADDLDEVVVYLRKLAASRPDDPDPCLLLASALVVQGDTEEAAWTAARAAARWRDDPQVVFRAAENVRWLNVKAARDYVEHVKRLLDETHAENTFVFRAELLALDARHL